MQVLLFLHHTPQGIGKMRAESRHGSDRQKGAVPAGSHEVPMALTWEADHLHTLHISCYPIKYFLFMTGSTATHALLEDAASNPFQHTDNFRTQICPSSPGTAQLCFSSFVALSSSMPHCADTASTAHTAAGRINKQRYHSTHC